MALTDEQKQKFMELMGYSHPSGEVNRKGSGHQSSVRNEALIAAWARGRTEPVERRWNREEKQNEVPNGTAKVMEQQTALSAALEQALQTTREQALQMARRKLPAAMHAPNRTPVPKLTVNQWGLQKEANEYARNQDSYMQGEIARLGNRIAQARQKLSAIGDAESRAARDYQQVELQSAPWFDKLLQSGDYYAQTYPEYWRYMDAVREGRVPDSLIPEEAKASLEAYADTSDATRADYSSTKKALEDDILMFTEVQEIYSLPESVRQSLIMYANGDYPASMYMQEKVPEDLGAYFKTESGSPDRAKIEELRESYTRYQNKLRADAKAAGLEDMSTLEMVAGNIVAPVTNLVGGIVGTVGSAIGLLDGGSGRYKTQDTNTGAYDIQRYTSAVRRNTREAIEGEDPGFLRKLAGYVYGAASSASDNLTQIGVGMATGISPLALMAASSFSSAYEDAASRGAGELQALLYAGTSAALEAATEKIPLDRLLSESTADTLGKKLKDILLTQPALEIAEEEASYFAGLAADAIIMGRNSENQQRINALIASGYSRREAESLVMKDVMWGAVETAVETGLSSGMMTGTMYAAGAKQGERAEPSTEAHTGQPRSAATQTQARVEASGSESPATDSRPEPAPAPVESPIRPIQPVTNPVDAAMLATFTGRDVNEVMGRTPAPAAEQESYGDGMENSVGAAAAGVDPFSRLQFEYGNIPPGEAPVRPDDMPLSTDGTNRVSYSARTVKGAAATPDEFSDLIDKQVVNGDLTYIPIKNSKTVEKATSYIRNLGWDEARLEWASDVRGGRAGPEMSAVGALLLNNAAKAGDKKAWLDILSDYQHLATNTAQGLQAMRILKTLAPSDKLYMIRRSVQQMAKDMHLGQSLEIDEKLAAAYQEAKSDQERDEIMGQIQQSIADQIPSTFMDKFTALRYVSMLGNLKTQGRNVLGNFVMMATRDMKDEIKAGIEFIASKATHGAYERTTVAHIRKENLQAAKEDFNEVSRIAMGGGKYADSAAQSTSFAQGVQDKRKIFKAKSKAGTAILSPLEGYRKLTNWAMEKGDQVFTKRTYARALAGYLQAHGVKDGDFSAVDAATMDKARAHAIKEAQEATFRDSNALSDSISKMGRRKDTHAAVRVVSEGIMPFRKTPANVLVRAEEYSPLGIINSIATSIKAAQQGSEVTGADVVNSWAKTLTGTGIFLLGMLGKCLGVLNGGEDEDEDQAAFDRLNGYQPYSLNLGDISLTMEFASPAVIPLFMGVEMYDMIQEGGFQIKDLSASLLSLTDPLVQMSMMQGVNDTLDNVRYSDSSLMSLAVNASLGYLTQGLTNTAFGQLERSFEDARMTTYVDKNSPLSADTQRFLGKMSAKTPGWDYNQTPYINEWGETEDTIENPLARVAYNVLSPSYISKRRDDNVTRELQRLADARGSQGVFPQKPSDNITVGGEKVYLTASQYEARAKGQGQSQRALVEAGIETDAYQSLSEEGKAKYLEYAYDYAEQIGNMRALPDQYKEPSAEWMKPLNGETGEAAVNAILKKARMFDVGASSEVRYDKAAEMGFTDNQMRETFAKVSQSLSDIEDKNDYDTYRAVLSATEGGERDKWLEVYGLSESRLEELAGARKRGVKDEEFIDALELASGFSSANSKINRAWAEGETPPAEALEAAYSAYENAGDKVRNLAKGQLSKKYQAYLELRDLHMSTETFLKEVKKYNEISETSHPLNEATRWAKALDDDVRSGLITAPQREVLEKNLRYFVQIPQSAEQYEELRDAGLSSDVSEKVMTLVDGLLPAPGKSDVSVFQKMEAIADSNIDASLKEGAMRTYMSDSQKENMDEAMELGLLPTEYVDLYRIYLETDDYGKGRKNERIRQIQQEFGLDWEAAKALIEIYE